MKFNASRLLNRSLSEIQLTWITRCLLAASLLLIIALSYSYDSINEELIFYSEKVDRTQRIISIQKDVAAEIYQTAYLSNSHFISKDTVYYNKTLAALKSLSDKVEKLDSISMQNDAQSKRAASLTKSLAQFERYTLLLAKFASANPALSSEAFMEREKSIDLSKKLIADMAGVESKLLHTRIQTRDSYTQKMYKYNSILVLVAAIFLSSAFILLDREISRNKIYRINLENKIENLNRSNSELEQFAYVASHDLQEPLRKIRSFSDRTISKYGKELPDDAYQMLLKIDHSSRRMQALIQDLLTFSRIVNTGLQPQILDLNNTLEQAKSNLSEMLNEQNAVIHSENLPSINAHASQMEQLFQNLLSNSIKYHRKNITPEVRITHSIVFGDAIPMVKSGHSDLEFHMIKVSDNGIGFKKEFSEKIFLIFQRLHDQHEFAGTGIGLAICKRIVSNHNGYIFAESVEGKGADFYIYLPAESLLE